MKRCRSTMFAAGVMLLAATPVGAAKAPDPLADIRTVIVVSALGNDVAWQDIIYFDTSNTNDRHLVYHPDWNPDDIVKQKAVDALSGRFTVMDESVAPDLLEGLLPGTTETISSKLQERFAGVTPMQGLDAYVIIHLRPSVEGLTGTLHFDGLNVVRMVGAFNDTYFNVAADFQVTVIDARTGKAIASERARHPMVEGNIFMGPIAPWEQCEKSLWAPTPEALTDEQKQQLRDEFYALAVKSLPYAFAAAKLTPPIKEDVDTKEWEGRPLPCHGPG